MKGGGCIVSIKWWFLLLQVVSADSSSPLTTGKYTLSDDASWALFTKNLTDPIQKKIYDDYMDKCRKTVKDVEKKDPKYVCDEQDDFRMKMNRLQPQSVYNYTQQGFLKIKAPENVFKLIHDFWKQNRDKAYVEWEHVTPYHNTWDTPPTILHVMNKDLPGGGQRLSAAIANAARDALEAWTGVQQAPSSVYGIRIYHNQSILSPHVDRLPLVSSAIINVDQDVDEPWVLEVYSHDGVAHNVTMEPGDLVLYESHSIVHGRPFPLNGKFFANIFVHFEPLNAPTSIRTEPYDRIDFPPYLIQGSVWESEWKKNFPNGWTLLNDPFLLIQRNDIRTLQYLAKVNPSELNRSDGSKAEWRPIHEAARQGYTEILQFLIDEQGIDVNTLCQVGNGRTPLQLVYDYFHDENHPAAVYLQSVGGVKDKNKIPSAATRTATTSRTEL